MKSRSLRRMPHGEQQRIDGERPGDEREDHCQSEPLEESRAREDVREVDVRPSATKTTTSARLASEVWNRSISSRRGTLRVAEEHPGDEHGEEPRAVRRRGDRRR